MLYEVITNTTGCISSNHICSNHPKQFLYPSAPMAFRKKAPKHSHPAFLRWNRITSYNVCYTKLLRALRIKCILITQKATIVENDFIAGYTHSYSLANRTSCIFEGDVFSFKVITKDEET